MSILRFKSALYASLFAACIVFLSGPDAKAIAFDNSGSGSCGTGCVNNTNWQHAVSGENRGILVFLQAFEFDGSCDYHAWYNNTEMTKIAETAIYDSYYRTFAFKQENPSLSATGVSIVSIGGCGFVGGSVSYSGVNQSAMVDTVATSTNPAYVVASVTTTTGVANSMVVSAHGQTSGSTWIPGSGQTERVDAQEVTSRSIGITEMFVATTSTVQMTNAPSGMTLETGSVVVSLKPSQYQITGTPSGASQETGSVVVSLNRFSETDPIRFDSACSGSCPTGCVNNTNWNHTVSGNNRGILVFLQGYEDSSETCDYHAYYGNTEMTSVGETASYDGGYYRTFAFKMENPPTSATGVSIVSRGGCGYVAASVSYTGVAQGDMIDVIATSTNPAYVIASVSSVPTTADPVLVSAHGQASGSTWTPGNGQTERVDAQEATSRSLEITDKNVATSDAIQMIGTPTDQSLETGSIVISLRPSSTGTKIALDNSGSGSCPTACVNNTNWNHTVSGNNRGILVFLQGYEDSSETCDYHAYYGNTEMTSVGETASYDGGYYRTFAFKMENPPTSATGVSIVSRGGCGFVGGSVSYTDVDQVDMVDTVATSTNPAYVVASVTTTTGVANSMVVSAHGQTSGSTWIPGSGQTERVDAQEATSRSIGITEMFVATTSTVQMTDVPTGMTLETGSIVVSLTPAVL